MIDPPHSRLSIQRRCGLASINRSAFYYQPAAEPLLNPELMKRLDQQLLDAMVWITPDGPLSSPPGLHRRPKVGRLMAKMGLAAIYQA